MSNEELRAFEALDQELDTLGSVMQRQIDAEASPPRPDFVRELRLRLAGEPERTVSAAPAHPRRRRFAWPVWGGVAAAALAAAVAVFFVASRSTSPHHAPVAAGFVPPTPVVGDLTRSYPPPQGLGGGGKISPVVSLIDLPFGAPYTGRLRLRAARLPSGPTQLPAYRLYGPEFDLPRLRQIARALHIRGLTQVITAPSAGPQTSTPINVSWAVLAQGDPRRVPYRSVAISQRTGELLYHNIARPLGAVPSGPAVPPPLAVLLTRRWLTQLGWPGQQMPLQQARVLFANVVQVTFGWAEVAHADTFSAAIWVAPGDQITEARLEPPIAQPTMLPARPVASAWRDVLTHRVPVGVVNAPFTIYPLPPGRGTFRRVSVVEVLTTNPRGRSYLVPAYRFAGRVRLRGVAAGRRWYAIVPAVR